MVREREIQRQRETERGREKEKGENGRDVYRSLEEQRWTDDESMSSKSVDE